MILSVAYDLHNPGRDYDDVIKTIKTAASWCHPQESVWFIDTSLSPSDWVDKLKAAGDPNDELLVIRVSQHWSSFNMDKDAVVWFKSTSRTW